MPSLWPKVLTWSVAVGLTHATNALQIVSHNLCQNELKGDSSSDLTLGPYILLCSCLFDSVSLICYLPMNFTASDTHDKMLYVPTSSFMYLFI